MSHVCRDLFSPSLSEEERRKQRRNKKERGGSLFSLRKKKDKKEGGKAGPGLAKAGSAVSLGGEARRAVSSGSGGRVPQHSYSMSSLKRAPQQPAPASSQFYLARSESRYVPSSTRHRHPAENYNDYGI